MSSTPPAPSIPRSAHLAHLRATIDLATHSPPQPSNFRVGCAIVSFPLAPSSSSSSSGPPSGTTLSTGYTLERPGNTHAEQNALSKLSPSSPSSPVAAADSYTILYTSLEPCSLRLSGAEPCVSRILAHNQTSSSRPRIQKVVFGAKEPGTFVKDSQSCRLMSEGGLEWEYIPDLEGEVLRVAMAGHNQTNVDNITDEERKRQEALPRNPKKRMMEVPPPSSAGGSQGAGGG